jgi:nitrogen fixation protein FixH
MAGGRGRPLTGRAVLAIFGGAFAVILTANLTLAWYAVGTFPGLVVRNSYIASQGFDRDRAAQQALGWTLTPGYDGQAVTLAFTDAAGRPVDPAALDVTIGRPASDGDDMRLAFAAARGVWRAPVALAPGQWLLAVQAEAADGTAFRQHRFLHVAD